MTNKRENQLIMLKYDSRLLDTMGSSITRAFTKSLYSASKPYSASFN